MNAAGSCDSDIGSSPPPETCLEAAKCTPACMGHSPDLVWRRDARILIGHQLYLRMINISRTRTA